MAGFILVCRRRGRRPELVGDVLRQAAARIAPDGIDPRGGLLLGGAGICAVVVSASSKGLLARDDALCLGAMIGEPGEWWRTGAAAPDGTYVMARWDLERVELVSDTLASRTIWYAYDDEVFIASTSQRAIVAILGDFRLDPEAAPALITNGTLGPGMSWDARLSPVPGSSTLTFDRRTWRPTLTTAQQPFIPATREPDGHLAALRDALDWTCANLDIDMDSWLLPLSGGRDSRALLAFMVRAGLRPRCITWTTSASLRQPLSDASIARAVARRFGVEHHIVLLDRRGEPAVALDRFVALVEGRCEDVAAYADGCRIWRDLVEDGVTGVVRGDQAMGTSRRAGSWKVAFSMGCGATVESFAPGDLVRRLGLIEQEWPESFHPRPGETLRWYRERMYEQGIVPCYLAPLNDLKASFVEVANPLLSRRIVSVAHELPIELRRFGILYGRAVDVESRPIPYARFSSIMSLSGYLEDPGVTEVLVRELVSTRMERVLSEDAVLQVLTALSAREGGESSLTDRAKALAKLIRKALPVGVGRRLTPPDNSPEDESPVVIAWRATMASKMIALLEEDATSLREGADRLSGWALDQTGPEVTQAVLLRSGPPPGPHRCAVCGRASTA